MATVGSCCGVQVSCCISEKPSFSHKFDATPSSSSNSISFKPLLKEMQLKKEYPNIFHIKNVPKIIKDVSVRLVDALVDATFEFIGQPLLPSQSNFAPVQEIEEPVQLIGGAIVGRIPDDFPGGVYIRNGPNPLFGGLKSTNSIFGNSSHTWIEGEGMLHAIYFSKDNDGRWKISYNNRHVQTETFKLEKDRKSPGFLPALEGDSLPVLSAYLLNFLRFGMVNKYLSNTNVFEHSGKFYSIAENHVPQEIDIFNLETKRNWDVNGSWIRPFTSHPKKDLDTGELVIMGIYAEKPYFELGVISADGQKLVHKVDLKLDRCCFCHEIGLTTRYNVIMDFPLTLDINRLVTGGPLLKYNKDGYARIGIMPRYGEADSVQWFEVEPNCTFHIINCFDYYDEVVVLGCRARNAIVPGPDFGGNKFEWFSQGFKNNFDEKSEDGSLFAHAYEWRLNLRTGQVTERNLTGTGYSMDFPIINEKYIGKENMFGYTQVVDSNASSLSGMAKYGGLAKLYFNERRNELSSGGRESEELIKVEYHKFPENTFCSGSTFVPKSGGVDEDDGWIITHVHDEDSNTSQVYIVDAKKFPDEPIAKITLPCRVPYGFHGAFFPI